MATRAIRHGNSLVSIWVCLNLLSGSQYLPLWLCEIVGRLRNYGLQHWKSATALMDYHVEFDERMYGVPYQLVGSPLRSQPPKRWLDLLSRVMVARHMRLGLRQRYSTLKEPCPLPQRRWRSLEMMAAWGGTSSIGSEQAIVLSWSYQSSQVPHRTQKSNRP